MSETAVAPPISTPAPEAPPGLSLVEQARSAPVVPLGQLSSPPASDTPPPAAPVTPPVDGAAPPATETPPPPAAPDWGTLTGGRFASEDAFKAFLAEADEAVKAKQNPYALLPADEKAYLDFVKAGGDAVEYKRMVSTDYDALSDVDMLRLAWEQAKGGIYPSDDVKARAWEVYLASRYPDLASDDASDVDVLMQRAEAKAEADQLRSTFKQQQAQLRLPTLPAQTPAADPFEGVMQGFTQYQTAATTASAQFKSVPVTLPGSNEVQYVPLPTGSAVPTYAQDPFSRLEARWMREGGTPGTFDFDPAKVLADMARLEHPEVVGKHYYDAGAAAAKAGVFDQLRQPDATGGSAPTSGRSLLDEAKSAPVRSLTGAGGSGRTMH